MEKNGDCNWALLGDRGNDLLDIICIILTWSFDRIGEPKQAHWAQEAREYLRKKLIGKHVKVHIDFIRPREGEFEERECATIRFGAQNVWVGVVASMITRIDQNLLY